MTAIIRLPLLLCGMLALLSGVLAGLARLGVAVPALAAQQTGQHGALMIAAFLGTVIGLERAVALNRPWAYLAPLCAGLGGLAMIGGLAAGIAPLLALAGASLLTVGSLLILRQQPALYTLTLALGAIAWWSGCLVWLITGSLADATPWWMAFLVLTIAGERLELTRLMRPSPGARKVFVLIVTLMLSGLALTWTDERAGLVLYATSLALLAVWLMRNDIARRTVRQSGLTRFIAFCLLGGYIWLAIGGLLGAAGGFTAGNPLRDAALHAVFLGFVFAMIFGHAPIIFPAVARIGIAYHPSFYLPLLLLHSSLLLRFIGDLAGPDHHALVRHAGIGNALTIAVFIATMAAGAWRGRRNAH